MADRTGIEWTDATWNPIVGCSLVSPGCTNCYAMKMAHRLQTMGQPIYQGHTIMTKAGPVWNGVVEISNWGQVIKPMSWRRPRRIFVNSMSDLFHPDLPDYVRDVVFAVMANCPQHTFQVLTKRADIMRDYLSDPDRLNRVYTQWYGVSGSAREVQDWPLPNVWLGVSVEDQDRADERIQHLRGTPAAIRFLSCEPLIAPVDLDCVKHPYGAGTCLEPGEIAGGAGNCVGVVPAIDWVIVGGESGPGARPMHPDWVRTIRDECAKADVPFFFKQWGDWLPGEPEQTPNWRFQDGSCIDGNCLPEDLSDDPPGWNSGLQFYEEERQAIFCRVGKKKAGSLLDGRQHMEFPS